MLSNGTEMARTKKLDGRTGLVYNNDNSRVHGKSGEILRGHTGYGGSLPCSGYKR